MLTMKLKSDELARFLIHTIATNGHSAEAIASTFALRDPQVLQRLLFRVLESNRSCRLRAMEVLKHIEVSDIDTQLPTILQVLPYDQVYMCTICSLCVKNSVFKRLVCIGGWSLL